MQVNKKDAAPETGAPTAKAPQFFGGGDASALKSEGSNTEVLSVRISPELMAAIHKMAEGAARPVPELVRGLLLFHLLPNVLKAAADRILTDDSSVRIFHKLYFDATGARKHLGEVRATVADARRRLDALEKMNTTADERLAEAEAVAVAAWDKYVAQLKEYHEEIEASAPTEVAPETGKT